MTLTDLHDFVVRTTPAAAGTALYAFTQLGLVAWLTSAWIMVQMVRFCLDWYRAERIRYKHRRQVQIQEDAEEEGYP